MITHRTEKPAPPKMPKTKLGLPDLEHSKASVLNSLRSPESKRGYRHAIDEFVHRYCSEPCDERAIDVQGVKKSNNIVGEILGIDLHSDAGVNVPVVALVLDEREKANPLSSIPELPYFC